MSREIRLTCDHIDEKNNYKICGKPADWIAKWSDRTSIVCNEHKDSVLDLYEGESEGDKIGIEWSKIIRKTNTQQTINILEYIMNKGCSELEKCEDCPIYQEYHKIKKEKDNSKKWIYISLCNVIYGIKRTKKQIPLLKEDD